MLKPLNKHFAPKSVMPEKVIQFGEIDGVVDDRLPVVVEVVGHRREGL